MVVHSSIHARIILKMAVLIVPHRLDDDNDDDNGNDYDDYMAMTMILSCIKGGKQKTAQMLYLQCIYNGIPRPLAINRQVLLRPGSESKLFMSRTEFETTQII